MALYEAGQIDQLRDILEDPSDTQVSFALKQMYLNQGLGAMWPRVYQVVLDSTTTLVDDTYEYTIPAAVRGGHVITYERSTADDPTIFAVMDNDDYRVIQGAVDADRFQLTWDPGDTFDGGYIRITAALPLTRYAAADYTAAGTTLYTGPDYTYEGPVLYALSRIFARPLDRRMDFGRVSVQNQNRNATPQDILSVSAYWLDEFERRLEEWRLPLPISRF